MFSRGSGGGDGADAAADDKVSEHNLPLTFEPHLLLSPLHSTITSL